MTNPLAYQQAAIVADLLLRDGEPLVGFDGLDDGRLQFSFVSRDGLAAEIAYFPPKALDEVQALVREALRKFETANRNGFDLTGKCDRGLPGEGAPE